MKIAILTIGDELLNGDLADTNTRSIANRLAEDSLVLSEVSTVGDREEVIASALLRIEGSSVNRSG